MQLLEVQNLIFVLPLTAAFLLILLMAVGIPMGDSGVHVDVGHTGIDTGHEMAAVGGIASVLSFFGVGRVPFAVTLISFAMTWGVAGLVVNQVWPGDRIWFPVLLAATAAALGTRWASVAVARLLPSVETYAVPAAELVRHEAVVIHEVDASGGAVRLTDRLGTLRDLNVKGEAGGPRIARGSRVLLTEYDPATDTFRAEPLCEPAVAAAAA